MIEVLEEILMFVSVQLDIPPNIIQLYSKRRIKGIQKQRIYKIDKDKDYKALSPLVNRNDRTIHMDWICDQWDRLGHFYCSLEHGHIFLSVHFRINLGNTLNKSL